MTGLDAPCWLMPDGIEECPPGEAQQLEWLRHEILELFRRWGYRLVIPPFIEYLDSLLLDASPDLVDKTFKLTDPLSGRLLGVRADMTPQVARLAALHRHPGTPTRSCYLGTVLHTRADAHSGSRAPIQLGAELYGTEALEGDAEIVSLMLHTLDIAGVDSVHLDLGHSGVIRALVASANLPQAIAERLFDVLQRKAAFEIHDLLAQVDLSERMRGMFHALADLNGELNVLQRAREQLTAGGAMVLAAVEELGSLAEMLRVRHPHQEVHVDLAELRGYRYHAGVVFAAYQPGRGQEIARGGRYHIGADSGCSRPGTGFSTDLKMLARIGSRPERVAWDAVFAPWTAEPGLHEAIARLREQGECVVMGLPEQSPCERPPECRRVLVRRAGKWRIESI